MRELLKRLDRLESAIATPEAMRIVRVISLVIDGREAPWNPGSAYARRRRAEDAEVEILRHPGEPIEAFEARAAAHFPGDYIIG